MQEKLVVTGGSMYILIPPEWRKRNKLKRGMKLDLRSDSDGSLVVRVSKDDDGL